MKPTSLQMLFTLAMVGVSIGAGAQAASKGPGYPTKPMRFVVPLPSGGTPDIQERRAAAGAVISGGTPLHFRDYLGLGYAKFSKLVQEAGISLKTGS